ncbi:OB-fold nucleic acid binding domain-containing protein, partial [Colibacter massiliensis]
MDTMIGLGRSQYCAAVTEGDTDKEVVLCGWVERRRDHGGLIFIDLRDRTGIVQVVASPDYAETAFKKAEEVRNEYVLAVRGIVRLRDEATINEKMKTGKIEIRCEELRILNTSKTPPFYIEDNIDVDEKIRLKYRYLDLRRPEMQNNLIMR